MLITEIEAIGLRAARIDAGRNDPTQEVVVVRVHTDAGLTGLAECNHSVEPVLAVFAANGSSSIAAGVRPLLLGRDPLDREALMRELYERNILSLRRGLGLAALNAVDVCLWDLIAQSRREPLWRTLWGQAAAPPHPYLTLYTGPGTLRESMRTLAELVERGMPLGYTAAKLEPLEDCVPEEAIEEFVAEGRRLLGDGVELFVDFGHRFRDATHAARHIDAILDQQPALIETPLLTDDVWEYARLAELSPVPLAASELYESVWEFRALVEVGRAAIVQPWPARVGVTGTLDVAAHAQRHGARCILAGWNTTAIGIATGLHIAAGLGPGITLEHAPTQAYGFSLRTLVAPEPAVVDGAIELPNRPGLGVSLDEEAVARHRI